MFANNYFIKYVLCKTILLYFIFLHNLHITPMPNLQYYSKACNESFTQKSNQPYEKNTILFTLIIFNILP